MRSLAIQLMTLEEDWDKVNCEIKEEMVDEWFGEEKETVKYQLENEEGLLEFLEL